MCLCFAIEPAPTSFNYSTLGVLAANGSSAVGGCSNITTHPDRLTTCNTPTSSVLFDGVTPTLTGLDGDTWASQLMILQRPEFGYNSFYLDFDFTGTRSGYAGVERVEVTIFNCPEWGTAVEYIQVRNFTTSFFRTITTVYPTVFSCDSLLKVCIPAYATSPRMQLYFDRYSSLHKVHIAEIAFYGVNAAPCDSLFTTIPGNWTPPSKLQ